MKKADAGPTRSAEIERLMSDLSSPNDAVRAKAVRSVCPCRLGWGPFQQCLAIVRRLQKDPSLSVRRAAIHVIEEAYEMDSSGRPTSRQETKNEMVATRRRMRWRSDDDEC